MARRKAVNVESFKDTLLSKSRLSIVSIGTAHNMSALKRFLRRVSDLRSNFGNSVLFCFRRSIQVFLVLGLLPWLKLSLAGREISQVRIVQQQPRVTAPNPHSRMPGNSVLNLTLGLPLRRREELLQLIQEVSNPTSTRFRHYLTPEEFADRFGPTQEDYQAVVGFARQYGLSVTQEHPNRTLIGVKGPVSRIEEAFQLRLNLFQHPTENRTYFSPDRPPVPRRSIPIAGISGLDSLSPPRPASVHPHPLREVGPIGPQFGSDPSGYYIGSDFRNAYAPGVQLNGSGQRVALVEFDGYYPTDISRYLNRAKLSAVNLTNILLNGFNGAPDINNLEVALDIDMAICMAPALDRIAVYEGYDPNSVLNQIANDNLASQISCSWSWQDPWGAPLLEQILEQFVAQGQTYFTASGDSGAWLGAIDSPIDYPWVTSVGGTTLSTPSGGGPYGAETVWNWSPGSRYASSGGVSVDKALPLWQSSLNFAGFGGASTGRNVPDVALTADHIIIFANNGSLLGLGGTSAAAPLWAGFNALVNQQQAAAGLGPVGFINPLLYQIGFSSNYSVAFHDITKGHNSITSGDTNHYFARAGYDLCTGWGSPRGPGAINLLSPPALPQLTSTVMTSIVPIGSTMTFSAIASGTPPLTFQWQREGTNIPGATSNILTLTNIQLDQAGDYRVVIANYLGSQTNLAGSLIVQAPPTITTQPVDAIVLSGGDATFQVIATGSFPLSYQWIRDGQPISDATSSSFTLSPVTPIDSGALFACRVSNIAGSTLSQSVLLTVNSLADNADVPLISPWQLSTLVIGMVILGTRSNRNFI